MRPSEFQFTHPGRGATLESLLRACVSSSFNSRTPGGVRRLSSKLQGAETEFQFTHPGRGATPPEEPSKGKKEVSIHAPREGCDRANRRRRRADKGFQFTHPGRGATVWCKVAYYRADKQAQSAGRGVDRVGGDTLFALGLVMWLITSSCG